MSNHRGHRNRLADLAIGSARELRDVRVGRHAIAARDLRRNGEPNQAFELVR